LYAIAAVDVVHTLSHCYVTCHRRHHITIYVEPKVYQDLLDEGRVLPQQQQQQQQALQNSSSSSSGCLSGKLVNTGAASKDGAAAAAAAGGGNGALVSFSSWPVPPGGQSRFSSSSSGAAGASAFSTAAPAGPGMVQGAGLVKTWQPEVTICQQQQQQQGEAGSSSSSSDVAVSDVIPEEVAQQLDLVLVLGGDGTVLWTCHIFGNRWEQQCLVWISAKVDCTVLRLRLISWCQVSHLVQFWQPIVLFPRKIRSHAWSLQQFQHLSQLPRCTAKLVYSLDPRLVLASVPAH
jgi:hypothetical protein